MSAEPSIGIDLGTTNSVVATVLDGKPRLIERREGQRLLASMVGYTPSGERVVGEVARKLSTTHPSNVAFATKRLMGQRWSPELVARYRTVFPYQLVAGPSNDVRVRIAERAVPVAQIAAALLSELRQDANAFLGSEVTKAVVTVPANFNDAQRQATKEAAQIAGLDVIRLVNEPTAAAIAYGLHTNFQGRVLVFDLGGGTLDVSILEMKDGVFEVVATGGDSFLGGEDFDQAVAVWLAGQVPWAGGEKLLQDRMTLLQLRMAAESVKCTLSTAGEASVDTTIWPERGDGLKLKTTLSLPVFEELVRPLVDRSIAVIDKTLAEARLEASSIGQVIVVGGMTRMPMIRRRVGERFRLVPATHMFPDEVVALGAAIHAHDLVSRQGRTVLLDIVSNTLGIEVAGGLSRPLIAKNRALPCRAREVFYPAKDDQTVVRIAVVQGESSKAVDNALLGEVRLDKLLGGWRGEKAVEVTFDLDLNGNLAVSACEICTGRTVEVKVQARTDLQPREIERLRGEEAQRQAAAQLDPEERRRNAEQRATLRKKLVALRRVHSQLVLAADEAEGQPDARLVVDALGVRLVEAERLEQTGSVAEVQAMSRNIEELVAALNGAPSAAPAAAGETGADAGTKDS